MTGLDETSVVSSRRLLTLAWPLALQGLVSVLVTSNDVVLLGRTSAVVVSSAVVASSTLTVAVLSLSSLAIGAQIEAARARGTGRSEEARAVVESGLRVVALVGLPVLLGLAVAAPWLSGLLAGAAADAVLAAAYLRVTLFGAPFAVLAAVLRVAATAYARTRVVLVAGLVSAGTDVGLSLLLVGELGWLGVALGTVAGQLSSAVTYLVWRARLPVPDRPRLSVLVRRAGGGHERAVAGLGWPEAVLALFSTASGLVVVIVLSRSTPEVLAGARVLDVQLGLAWVALNGCGQALLTVLAETQGAGRDDLARTALRNGLRITLLAAVVFYVGVAPWSGQLTALAGGPAVAAAVGQLGWFAWAQCFWQAACVVSVSVCRSLRDTRAALLASLVGEYAVFLPAGLLLCRWLDLDVFGVLVAHHLFWCTFVLIATSRARRGWSHRAVPVPAVAVTD